MLSSKTFRSNVSYSARSSRSITFRFPYNLSPDHFFNARFYNEPQRASEPLSKAGPEQTLELGFFVLVTRQPPGGSLKREFNARNGSKNGNEF